MRTHSNKGLKRWIILPGQTADVTLTDQPDVTPSCEPKARNYRSSYEDGKRQQDCIVCSSRFVYAPTGDPREIPQLIDFVMEPGTMLAWVPRISVLIYKTRSSCLIPSPLIRYEGCKVVETGSRSREDSKLLAVD